MKFLGIRSIFALIVVFFVVASASSEDGFDSDEDNDFVGGIDPTTMDAYKGMFDGYGGGGGDGYGDYGSEPGSAGVIATELDSVEEINAFLSEVGTSPMVLAYFDDSNTEDRELFDKIAASTDGAVRFGFTVNQQVLAEMKYKTTAVFVYKPPKFVNEKFEKARVRYPVAHLKEEAFVRFITEKALPLVGVKDSANSRLYASVPLPEFTLFADGDVVKNFQYFSNRLSKLAQLPEFKDKLVFNVASREPFVGELKQQYGIYPSGKKSDVQMGIRADNYYFKPVNEVQTGYSADSAKEFIKSFLGGELSGKKRREEGEEEDVDDSNVLKLTNANFKAHITDSKADAMVEFYAPWCGHCKHLKPEYAEVANYFAGDDSVIIGALDATANDVPAGFDVQGYPTLYFVPGSSKKPVSYEGERTADAITAYIKQHRTTTVA